MTSKTMKTILFASVIAAMILPFSGMNFAHADEVNNTEKIQEKQIFNAILEIQEKADLARSELRTVLEKDGSDVDRWIAKGKLVEYEDQMAQLNAVLYEVSPTRTTAEFAPVKTGITGISFDEFIVQYAYATSWAMYDSNYGCSGSYQNWNVGGDVNTPTTTTELGISYPSSVSIGLSPWCSGSNWNNFGFQVDNITQDWSCVANFQVDPTDDFDATCAWKTMYSGDQLVITTAGNYDWWTLANTVYKTL